MDKLITIFFKFQSFLVLFILFLISFIAIYPYLGEGIIIGTGESGFLIDPMYMNLFYEWNDKINFGQASAFQANIVFFGIVWQFLKFFSVNTHPSVLWAFLAFFLPSISLYFCLDEILRFKNKFIYLPATLLYSFNIFRLSVSYTNTSQNILFIVLPLFFLFYYKLAKTPKLTYILALLVISFFSVGTASNLAVFSIPYVILAFYFLFKLVSEKTLSKQFILSNIVLLFGFLVINLYWMIPLVSTLKDSLAQQGGSLWNVLDAGTFFDHLRFMGFWAFKDGYGYDFYFPYFKRYYSFLLILSTMGVTVFSFYYIASKNTKRFLDKKIVAFISLLTIISIFAVAGAKGPTGFIYKYLYDNVSIFKIYREPYAKFMPLYIFSICFSLSFSLLVILHKIKTNFLKGLLIAVLSLVILFNAFPIFTKNAFYMKRWNQGPSGSIVVIPKYWVNAKEYIDQLRIDSHIAILPFNTYVTSNNWPFGINIVGNFADYFINANFVKGWAADYSLANDIISPLYQLNSSSHKLDKFLGLLNVNYVLQENDIEWRYSNTVLPPSILNKFVAKSNLIPIKDFGLLTEEYLMTLQNNEPDDLLRSELYTELTNLPALSLYEVSKGAFLPQFYIPNEYVYLSGDFKDLYTAFGVSNFSPMTLFYIQNNDSDFSENVAHSFISENKTQTISIGQLEEAIPDVVYSPRWDSDWSWPKVSHRPGRLDYIIVKLSEKINLKLAKGTEKKLDLLSWYGAKRIEEVSFYELSGRQQQKVLTEFVKHQKETIQLLNEQALKINSLDDLGPWYVKFRKAHLYYARGLVELEDSIVSDDILQDVYIFREGYANMLNEALRLYTPLHNNFTFNVPTDGIYDLMLTYDFDSWNKYDEIKANEKSTLTININDAIDSDRLNLIKDPSFSSKSVSKLFEINNWEPDQYYTISFEYTLVNSGVSVVGVEDTTSRKQTFEDELVTPSFCLNDNQNIVYFTGQDDCYYRYQRVIKSSEDSTAGYIYIEVPVDNLADSVTKIRNLKVAEYFEPNLVLVNKTRKPLLNTPTLEFSKINPTKYAVNIKGALEPYILVFNEQFNKNWKVSLDANSTSENVLIKPQWILSVYDFLNLNKIVSTEPQSYFDGKIVQKTISNKFELFPKNREYLDDSNPSMHFIANGFANGWLISPEDVNNKTDYTLVIEFEPQIRFTRLFVASLLIAAICIFSLLVLTITKKFKYRGHFLKK